MLSNQQLEGIRFLETLNVSLPLGSDLNHIRVTRIEKETAYIKVSKVAEKIHVTISNDHLLYRALYIVLPKMVSLDQSEFIEETPIVEVSYSLDASRNGVMKVEQVKKFIAYLGTMGFNTLYLYTEDTYEVEDLAYFGYLRGAYTKEEIKEIVSFSKEFGVEVVPSIQTLAHLTQFLKWYPVHDIMDDQNTLLIGNEKTYEAIEKMIVSCLEMYDTKKIHLGMDEAYQAGLGRYLELNGYTSRVDLMIHHINRVMAIVEKYDLEPIIWSDFIYKLLDKNNGTWLYDVQADIDDVKAKELPNHLTYVHWDYGGEDVAKYETVIDNHLKFCDLEHYVLAGGAHIWNRLAPNHGKSINTIKASIEACRNKQVKSVMLTTWGDDGQETDHWHSFVSAVNYVEAIYSTIDEAQVKVIYETLFGENTYELMSSLQGFDEVESVTATNSNMTNISKLLLWQDPILGIYDYHVEKHNEVPGHSLHHYYEMLSHKIATMPDSSAGEPFNLIQKHYKYLAAVLSLKADLGVRLRTYYLDQDNQKLSELLETDLPELIALVKEVKMTHYRLWHNTYKANGWEVIEHRYAILNSRLETLEMKIQLYLMGENVFEELLEERLPFSDYTNPIEIGGFNFRGTSCSGYN